MKRMKRAFSLLLAFCMLIVFASAAYADGGEDKTPSDVVQTSKGDIQGFTVEGAYGGEVNCYFGIPYAEAPVGELRWRDAQEKEPWDGVLDCTELKSSCYQFGDILPVFEKLPESEDCLYLNVIAPAATGEKLPVIVWYHGGGMNCGSGNEATYNMTRMPEHGCIVVTVTTRLGPLGTMAATLLGSEEGKADAGNFIISDMVMSMKWVHDNIAAFGGDPDNVTIAGESGGAGKVNTLMAVRELDGMFQRAIMQSGVGTAGDFDTAVSTGDAFMEALGVSTIEEARAVPAETIKEVFNNSTLSFSNFVDDYYLTDSPNQAVLSGNYNHVDVLMGANQGELPNLGAMMGVVDGIAGICGRVTEDGNKAYAYLFDRVPDNWAEMGAQAVHSVELAYMWGDYYDETEFWTGGPWEQNCMFYLDKEKYPQEDYIAPVMTEDDWAMMEQMMTMWVSFAAVGDPSTEDITWKPWSDETEDYIYLAYQCDPLSEMRTGFSGLAQPVDMDMMAATFGFAAGMHDTGSSDPSGETP